MAAALGATTMLAATPCAAQGRDSTRTDTTAATPHAPRAPHRLVTQVVTGTRLTAASDEKTPAQVDVLRIRGVAPGPAAAADALGRLPGVSVFDDQGSRAQPSLDLRGFTLSPVVGVPQGVSVFLDGVRVNEPDAQQVDFDLLPMDAVDHAELVRGPAALFGKNTLAGALSLTTKRGEATPVLDAQAEMGPFAYRGGRAIASGVRGGVDGFLLLRGSSEDGWRVDTPARTASAFATVGRRGDAGDVALSVLLARDRIGQAGSLPESWLAADRRTNYTVGDYFLPDLTHVALRGEHALFGSDARLRGNVFARRNAVEQFNVNVGAPSTRAFVTSVSRGGTAELSIPTTLRALPLGLTLGGELARSDVAYRVFDERSPYADTLPADCDARGLCENARVNQTDAALYAQGTLTLLEPLSVTAAARYDYVRVPFRDLSTPANGGTSTFNHVSPRLGVNVALPGDLRGFAAVSGGFRAPAALELACARESAPCPLPFSLGDDPPLRPVTLLDVEAGADWEPRRGASLEANVYRADVHNEIVFAASQNAAGYFQNVARTRRQGVELSGAAMLAGGLRVAASYTYTDATYRNTVRLASALADADSARAGDRFPLVPAHRATASVGVTHAVRATLLDGELSLRAASSQFLRGDEANDRAPLPGYALAALRVAVERPRWTVAANVTNLLDRRYTSFGVYGHNPLGAYPGHYDPAAADDAPVERFLTPGYPRAVTVTVGIRR